MTPGALHSVAWQCLMFPLATLTCMTSHLEWKRLKQIGGWLQFKYVRAFSNGGRMLRKGSSKSNNKKTSENNEKNNLESKEYSVHKRNLHVVSLPVILLFHLLRGLAYQLFVLCRYFYEKSTSFLHPAATNANATATASTSIAVSQLSESDSNGAIILLDQHSLPYSSSSHNEGPMLMSDEANKLAMASGFAGPGPGDPAFAKQKHHHRKAFEYISKALKIDEENEGKLQELR